MSPSGKKNILVISPQPWGRMFVSKHHYAVELCRRGHRVWFLEPARHRGSPYPDVTPVDGVPGLRLVSPRTFIPPLTRFKLHRLYTILVGLEVRALMRRLGVRFDLVWSFEPNLYPDLRAFGASQSIYHPVDMISSPAQLLPARSADLVLSVAENILDRVDGHRNKHFVHHGLGPDFVNAAQSLGAPWQPHSGPLRVGYVGNLFIDQLDRRVFRSIVGENRDVEFHVWGPAAPSESNVSAQSSKERDAFIRFLREAPNVRLRGVAPPSALARELHSMDAFLLCYDPRRDPAAGANSHKLLEYLSTGRLVVANHVSTYRRHDALLRMAPAGDNATLAAIFEHAMRNIADLNRADLHATRTRFALDQSYERQVDRIEALLAGLAGRAQHNPEGARAPQETQ
jgi:hypothetical protein